MPKSNCNRGRKETPGPKKPRGRAFAKGAENPARHRYHQRKNHGDSLASLIDNNSEIKGVSETDYQAYPIEQENCPGAKDGDSDVGAAKPWMSDTDIEKGTRSLNEITKALKGIQVGIVCLAPENLTAPWLLFEAGALSKTIIDDKTRLCTYLIGGLRPADIKQPLGMFQHTIAEQNETRKLMHTINKAVSESPVQDKILDEVFDAMWPKLQMKISELPKAAQPSATRRDLEDMVEEILELVRAEANARSTAANPIFSPNAIYGSASNPFLASGRSVPLNYLLGGSNETLVEPVVTPTNLYSQVAMDYLRGAAEAAAAQPKKKTEEQNEP